LNRDPRKLWRLKKIGYVNISEWEFFQFFSEAIVAGRPDSGLNPEITAGLQRSDVSTVEDPPHWFLTHRFSTLHKVPASGGVVTDGDKDGASTRNKLAELTNEKDVNSTVLEDLISTLCMRLNMDPSSNTVTPDTAIVELGVDSLLAVDIRAWFTKELDLDMPVLKILGGATVQDLVDDAVGRLDSQLVPKLARDGESSTTLEEPATAPVNNDSAVDIAQSESTSTEESSSVKTPAEEVLTVAPLNLPVLEEVEEPSSDISQQGWSTASNSPSSLADDSSDAAGPSSEVGPSSGTQTPITEDTDSEPEEPKQKEEHVIQEEVAKESIESEECETPVAKLFSKVPDRPKGELEFVKKAQMSHGTSRFWFLMQYLQDPTSFNLLAHLKCTGRVDFNIAEKAVRELGNRHEIFRTAFFADETRGNEPTMGVMKESPLQLERRTSVTESDIDAEVEELVKYDFKLEQGETIRAKILSLDENTHHVLFAFHHIAMDGFSFNILLAEVNQLYDGQKLAPVSMQFTDFADRQRKQISDGSFDGEFQFWKDMYSQKLPSGETKQDFPEPIPLFNLAQSTRKSLDNYEFEESSVVLDSRMLRQIKTQCKKYKITPFHFFLGVLRTFLFRQLDVDDLVIGIADANRTDDSVASTIGFMLNLLPLRFRNDNADQNTPFKDVVAEARKTAYDGLAHSKLPFDALLEKLNIPRSATHSPLFQVWMDYRPFRPDYMPTMFGGEASGDQTVGRNGYDLTLDVNEIDGSETRVSFRTQKYLYSAEATQALFDSYMRLVKSFASDFEVPISSVPLWEEKELESAKTLGKGRCSLPTSHNMLTLLGPALELEWPDTLCHRIANIASQWPNKEAVKDGNGKSHSYTQLLHRVQAISETLTQAGVTQGTRVAVFQEPSVDWVCSLLGIWHAGGTYIPMDLKNSLPRLAVIAASAKPAVIICHDETENLVPELKSSASHLVNVSSLQHAQPITKVQAKSNGTAVILFTSGSTGTPKGVILRHSAFRNTIEGLTKQYAIGAEKVLQQSAFTFDFSLDQIMCGLVNGGTVYVATKQDRADPVAIAKIIASENITYTRATPSEYAGWITYGAEHLTSATSWRWAWGGGETMPQSLPESIAGLGLEGLRLYNSYGPAESITCTKTEVSLDFDSNADGLNNSEIPAGYPLPNYSVYIVDRNLDLLPQGSIGEILIGGPSVAAGYLNQEKLSASKFISNPWDMGIVYRTGDTGYLRSDGTLMFKGRIAGDTQVKIRGIRIDLQDIESCILEASEAALHKAIVSVRSGDVLVAHVQFADGQYDDEVSQQAFLRQMRFLLPLPVYMVPSVFVPVDQLPVNSHGKTDRQAVLSLPLPAAQSNTDKRSEEDFSETERKLVELWKDAVPEEMKGSMLPNITTSFFELGGNSLLLVRLQRAVKQEFGVSLGIIDLFEASSLGAMAAKIDSTNA
jgi:hybrid polyketide synthase/nonribosomal peptide synthetase ACE1